MGHWNNDSILDTATKFKDAGLIAATAVTQVSSADYTMDLGAAGVYMEGEALVDVTACEVADGNELYVVQVQGSTTSNFSTAYQLATLRLGDSSVTGNAIDTPAACRHSLPFNNLAVVASGEAVPVRYIRFRTVVSGTVATGINYTGWVVKTC